MSAHQRQTRRKYVFEKFRGQCVWCRLEFDGVLDNRVTVDHIIPNSQDGSAWWENMLLSCKRCNNARGVAPVEEFISTWSRQGFKPNAKVIIKNKRKAVSNPLCRKDGYRELIHEYLRERKECAIL